jgi:hypothetical protein
MWLKLIFWLSLILFVYWLFGWLNATSGRSLYSKLLRAAEEYGWRSEITYWGRPRFIGEYRQREFVYEHASRTFLRSSFYRKILITLNKQTDVVVWLQGGMLVSLRNLFLSPGILVGDRSFDEQFVVKGKPPEKVLELLKSANVRQSLIKIQRRYGAVAIKISGMKVVYKQSIMFEDMVFSDIERKLDCLCDLADEIERLGE